MNIESLLTQPESKTLEFKQDLSSLKPILKTVVAFANTAGGILIIGYSPEKGLFGIDDILEAEESLTNSISDSIKPAILPEVDIKTIEGQNILIVRVAHQKGPFYLKSEGPTEGAYMRFGSSSRKAGPDMLADLNRHNDNISFDQLPCADLEFKALDAELVERFLVKIGKAKDDIAALRTLGIVSPLLSTNAPSNAGVILFGKPEIRGHYFADARISCARFKGIDKVSFIDRQEVEGSPIEALDVVLKFISRNTSLGGVIRSLKREDIPEFPPIAVREALLNAIIHGNYALSGRVMVAIYDDRLEIQSSGMFPYGMTMAHFISGVSHIRNRVIARVFRELGLIEEWGSGYRRISAFCNENGYPLPIWEEFGIAMRVTFKRHEYFEESKNSKMPAAEEREVIEKNLSRRQLEILDILSDGGLKMREILGKLKDPPAERTLLDDLSHLRKEGHIDFQGHTRSGMWVLKPKSD